MVKIVLPYWSAVEIELPHWSITVTCFSEKFLNGIEAVYHEEG